MPTIHAQVELTAANGLPEDSAINTFTINSSGAVGANPGEITTALSAFYNGLAADQGDEVGRYISGSMSRAAGGMKFRLYDITGHLDGSPHGPPFFEDTGTLIAAQDPYQLPAEVAVVLTLESTGRFGVSPEVPDDADPSGVDDPGAERDRPMQRRTGRIYFGPLNNSANQGNPARPIAALRENLTEALRGLQASLLARPTGPYQLRVWSRQNAQTYPIGSCYVDDAFDTQRRRGLNVSARTRLTFPAS